jgi:hypothetical protein
MLCASESTNRWLSDRRSVLLSSDGSCWPNTSPKMLSASPAPPVVVPRLRTLALSSPSPACFTPSKPRCLEALDAGESSRASLPKAWPLPSDRCVVALATSCGLDGARWTERAVEGRELTGGGRGGNGGGVPSRDGCDMLAEDVVREALLIMCSVGFAKSRCSTWPAVFSDALLLARTGTEGALCGCAAPSGSRLPISDI